MARFFVFVVVVGGLAAVMYYTKPSLEHFQAELEKRALVLRSGEGAALSELRSDNLMDRMVFAAPPQELMKRTTYDNYFILSVFTTQYQDAMGAHRTRTLGLFSSFISTKAD